MKKRLILKVKGQVQGIGYSYAVQKEAKRRGFTGYVKNTDAGGVEIVAEGDERDLQNFILFCYNGVVNAVVQKIDESRSEATGAFSDFVIRY